MKTIPREEAPGTEPLFASAPGMELKDLLAEAARSLASLDANRLEELAECCVSLRCGFAAMKPGGWANVRRQSIVAAKEMTMFGRVLEATRANLKIIERLGALPDALEYSESQVSGSSCREAGRGDD